MKYNLTESDWTLGKYFLLGGQCRARHLRFFKTGGDDGPACIGRLVLQRSLLLCYNDKKSAVTT